MTAPTQMVWTGYATNTNIWNWGGVAYGNGVFVAVAGGSRSCATSPDGITWTSHPTPDGVAGASHIVFGNGIFVIAVEQAWNFTGVSTSPDGITWTAPVSIPLTYVGVLAFGNGRFLITQEAYSNLLALSVDGITWTDHALPGVSTGGQIHESCWGIAYGNGVYVAVYANDDYQPGKLVATSPDGANWTEHRTMPPNWEWASIVFGNGIFVATGGLSAFTELAVFTTTSRDGINWTQPITVPVGTDMPRLAFGNGTFVIVGGNDSVDSAVSADGIIWTMVTMPAKGWWANVVYGAGKFVAVASFLEGPVVDVAAMKLIAVSGVHEINNLTAGSPQSMGVVFRGVTVR